MTYSQTVTKTASSLGRMSGLMLGIPFDIAREHYVKAVRAGIIEHSLLKSAKFEQGLAAMERLTLGPWARSA